MSRKPAKECDPRDWERAGEECLTALLDRIRVLVPEVNVIDFKLLTEATKVVGEVTGTALALRNPVGGEGGKGESDDGDE